MEWLQQVPWHYLAGPLVGAVIGYFTNYIAVKMLFRPRRPVMLGKWRLPLTPGIIPKRKPQMAHAIGQAVGQQLLTDSDLKVTLLSDEMKAAVADSVLDSMSGKGHTVEELLRRGMGEEVYDRTVQTLAEKLSDKLEREVYRMDLGSTIAQYGGEAIREKVSGTMLAVFVHSKSIDSMAGSIRDGVNRYLEEHLHELLLPKVEEELNRFAGKSTEELCQSLSSDPRLLHQVVERTYEELMNSKVDKALRAVDIAGIVERKINEMDVESIERLALSVMQHELQSIVSLGALIGFVIGILNVFLH